MTNAPASSHPTFAPPPLRQRLILFGVLAFSYAYFFNPLGWGQAARVSTMRAIVEDRTLSINRFKSETGDTVLLPEDFSNLSEAPARLYSNKPPGTVILGLPAWWAAQRLASHFSSAETALMWAQYASTFFAAGVPAAILIVMVFSWLVQMTGRSASSLVLAMGLGLGSMIFPFATMHYSHAAGTACLFGAFYAFWSVRRRGPPPRKALALTILGAFLCGYSVCVEYIAAIPASFIVVYGVSGIRRALPADVRRIAFRCLIAGLTAGLLALIVYNLAVAKRLLFISNALFKAGPSGFQLDLSPVTGQIRFPSIVILYRILFGAQRGLFFGSPWLLAGIGGLIAMARQPDTRAEAVLFTVISGVHVFLNCAFGYSILYWGGAWSCGPRHLITILPFLGAAAMFWRPVKRLIIPLVLWSVLLMLMATSIEPQFEPQFSNPFFQYAFPMFLDSNLGLGIGLGYLAVDHFHAWNLGRVFGLTGSLQLLPLYFVWLVGVLFLLADIRAGDRRDSLPALGT